MATTKLTSRDFNQDVGRAKRDAEKGPVVITDRGKPAHVLLTYREYKRLVSGGGKSIMDLLAMPGMEDIEFEPPRLDDELLNPVEFGTQNRRR